MAASSKKTCATSQKKTSSSKKHTTKASSPLTISPKTTPRVGSRTAQPSEQTHAADAEAISIDKEAQDHSTAESDGSESDVMEVDTDEVTLGVFLQIQLFCSASMN